MLRRLSSRRWGCALVERSICACHNHIGFLEVSLIDRLIQAMMDKVLRTNGSIWSGKDNAFKRVSTVICASPFSTYRSYNHQPVIQPQFEIAFAPGPHSENGRHEPDNQAGGKGRNDDGNPALLCLEARRRHAWRTRRAIWGRRRTFRRHDLEKEEWCLVEESSCPTVCQGSSHRERISPAA